MCNCYIDYQHDQDINSCLKFDLVYHHVVISSGMFQCELDASSNMVGIAYGNS